MPRKEYHWEKGALPEIAPHSLAKHRILREYVQRYLEVLTKAPGMDSFRIALVDGFAGGGEYRDSRTGIVHPGSPLILLDAVRSAEARINSLRSKALRINASHFFIEQNHVTADYLRDLLTERGNPPSDDGPIFLLRGAFEEHVNSVISKIKSQGRSHRAIFLLDQYGYTSVPISILSRIFNELPNAEVFLTIAVGWITAYLPNIRSAAIKLGIQPSIIEHLNESDGTALDVNNPHCRPDFLAIQQLLHFAFQAEIEARFYTPFFIVSRESHRPYWFLHLANNARANDVVKILHWEVENHFAHFGRPGLAMLGYDPKEDPGVTQQPGFDFGDAARDRTKQALVDEIPRRLGALDGCGTSFERFFQGVCNETPATRGLIAEVVRELCIEGELSKRGGRGERRAPATLPHNDDFICLSHQRKLPFNQKVRGAIY